MDKKNIAEVKKLSTKLLEMVLQKDQKMGEGELTIWELPIEMEDVPYFKKEIGTKCTDRIFR